MGTHAYMCWPARPRNMRGCVWGHNALPSVRVAVHAYACIRIGVRHARRSVRKRVLTAEYYIQTLLRGYKYPLRI